MRKIILPSLCLVLATCSPKLPSSYGTSDSTPTVFPDYKDITIPCNIAPMNFVIEEQADAYITVLESGTARAVVKGKTVRIPKPKWNKLISDPEITVQVYVRKDRQWTAYAPFSMTVSDDIDPYISYRIIPVAVESYEKLSLRQRNLTNFKEKVFLSNTMIQNNVQGTCINCHYYKNWETDNMMFHVRHYKGGTVLVLDGQLHKVNMKTDSTISAGVYPSWHPTHDYIALSNNKTHQSVHAASHDKLEVMDIIPSVSLRMTHVKWNVFRDGLPTAVRFTTFRLITMLRSGQTGKTRSFWTGRCCTSTCTANPSIPTPVSGERAGSFTMRQLWTAA